MKNESSNITYTIGIEFGTNIKYKIDGLITWNVGTHRWKSLSKINDKSKKI